MTDTTTPEASTPSRYGRAAITFHWVSAVLIIILLINGLFMTKLDDDAFKTTLYQFHVAMGSLVLLLTIARLIWAWRTDGPAPLQMPRAERVAYRGIHVLLYVGAILTAATGILMLVGSGIVPIAPEVVASEVDRSLAVRNVHWLLAMSMIVLLIGHVGGVLLYQRNHGKTLSRMGLGSG
jgi:cytochrome b561